MLSVLLVFGSHFPAYGSSLCSKFLSSTNSSLRTFTGTWNSTNPKPKSVTSLQNKHHKWDKVKVKATQSCPSLCGPMDYAVHGILQARILEWVAYPRAPALQPDPLPAEPQGKPKNPGVGSLSLLQRIFPARNWPGCLPHCRWILCQLSCQGSPRKGWKADAEGGKQQCHIPGPTFCGRDQPPRDQPPRDQLGAQAPPLITLHFTQPVTRTPWLYGRCISQIAILFAANAIQSLTSVFRDQPPSSLEGLLVFTVRSFSPDCMLSQGWAVSPSCLTLWPHKL